MREAWGSESRSFKIIGIKHAITNKFEWQEPFKFICNGCTFGAQMAQGRSEYILVKSMLHQSFPLFFFQ